MNSDLGQVIERGHKKKGHGRRWWIGGIIASLLAMGAVLAGWAWVIRPFGPWQGEGGMQRDRDERLKALLGKEVVDAAKTFDPVRIRATLSDLERMGERSSWENQEAASEYLVDRLRAMGLQPVIQEYPHEGRIYKNIVVSFEGRSRKEEILMAVAHYDSKNWVKGDPCPGADDNATGVSALLALTRVLPHIPRQRTWQMVFFSNEEKGRLGSRDFAQKARQEGKNIAGVIAIDVVGYRPDGISEFFRLADSALGAERKFKGLAKLFLNAWHAVRNGRAPLQMAFRSEELPLAPSPSERESMSGALFWQLGKACP